MVDPLHSIKDLVFISGKASSVVVKATKRRVLTEMYEAWCCGENRLSGERLRRTEEKRPQFHS